MCVIQREGEKGNPLVFVKAADLKKTIYTDKIKETGGGVVWACYLLYIHTVNI